MGEFSHLVQFFLSGITAGSIYALIAVSLLIVYRVSNLICFAQGEFFVIGALTMTTLLSRGIPYILSFLISLAVAVILGGLIQKTVIKRIIRSSIGTLIVMTIGISLLLRGVSLLIWGREAYVTKALIEGPPIRFFGASLPLQVLVILSITAACLFLLYLFFEKTLEGLAMRACAENQDGASLMGINVGRISLFAWMWGGGIGALAGMVVSPLLFIQYMSGIMPMVKGFIAMSIGGLGSLFGVTLGGFLLGLVEAYTIGLVSSKFADAVVFTVLVLCLLFKPSGLFGRT